jgi:hypothetical protein
MYGWIMRSGAPAPFVATEVITPPMAKEILAANTHNRPLRPGRVTQLASAIKRGEWKLNGETLKLAVDGTLIDGQHRLSAVLEAEAPIETLVMRDLPIEAQDTVDTGRKRRLADILKIEGYADSHALAAGINMLHRLRSGLRIDYSQSGAPSAPQAIELIHREPEIVRSVTVARTVAKQVPGPIGVFIALHCVFFKVDPEPTEEFYQRLKDGAELQRGDPLLHLRNQLMRPRKDRGYAQAPATVMGMTIKAFNLRRAGRQVEKLTFRKNEQLPAVDPPQQMTEALEVGGV